MTFPVTKLTPTPTLFAVVALIALSQSAHGAMLALDTFDVGAATVGDDPGDPNDIAWTEGAGSNLSVESRNIFPAQANALKNQGGASFRGHTGAIPTGPISLDDVGAELILSFDFETNNSTGLNNLNGGSGDAEGYRFGLFAADGSGYFVNIGVGGTGSFTIEKDMNTGNSRAAQTGNTLLAEDMTSPPTIDSNDGHTLVLTLARTVAGVQIDANYDSGAATLSIEDTTVPVTSFADIWGGTGDHSIDFWMDNVQVDFVPEPSAIVVSLVAIFGCLVVAARR